MTRGKIIFLNGPTGSGKEAICKALQEILEEPYISLSVDSYMHMVPERYMSDEGADIDSRDEEVLLDLYPKLITAIHHTIVTFASMGINLIVSHTLQRRDWLEECVALLYRYPVLFVGVECEIDELTRREQDKHHLEGLSRLQINLVHAHRIYDIRVDTCKCDPSKCAQQIQQALLLDRRPRAFSVLRQVMIAGTLWDADNNSILQMETNTETDG